MNQNSFDEMLPSYEDVIREEQRIQRSTSRFYTCNRCVLFANIFLSAATFLAFCMVWYTDVFTARFSNVTKSCNDVRYNINPIPTSSYFAVNVSLILCFALCYLMEWIASKIENYDAVVLMKKILWKTWILGTYVLFLLTFIGLLKCAAGVPYPYFFSDKNITNLYCKTKEKKQYTAYSLKVLDNNLRKSFPSCRSAVYTFSLTFMYIYVDHFDVEIGLHATQQLIIMIMGAWLTYFQFNSWEQGENHLDDILVGAGIGIVHAVIAVRARNMFGSVFHSRITKVQTIPNTRPSAPPAEFLIITNSTAL